VIEIMRRRIGSHGHKILSAGDTQKLSLVNVLANGSEANGGQRKLVAKLGLHPRFVVLLIERTTEADKFVFGSSIIL